MSELLDNPPTIGSDLNRELRVAYINSIQHPMLAELKQEVANNGGIEEDYDSIVRDILGLVPIVYKPITQLPADYHSVEQSNKRLIEAVIREGAIVQADDGYYVYWPSDFTRGFLTSHMLRVIADHLDTVNKPWDEQIAKDLGQFNPGEQQQA